MSMPTEKAQQHYKGDTPPNVLMTCSAGVVNDPRTWSGTPFALYSALNDCGLISMVAAQPPESSLARKIARKADRYLKRSHPSVDGPLLRKTRWHEIQHQARLQQCAATLHLGTYDVPARPCRQKPAYLYIDTTYDLWRRQSTRRNEVSVRQDRLFRRLEHNAINAANHIFAISDHVAENLVANHGKDAQTISVVGTGRGQVDAYAGPKDYTNGRILTVAKVRPEDKGIPLLLQAFAQARRQNPQLSLTVVGGQKITGIERMPGVQATGWLTEQELQALFEDASLFVMPASYEPWGLVYLEALSCQVPIMGLARNAFPQLSGHGEHGIVTQPDVDALARDLNTAMTDPNRLAAMGQAGLAFANSFTWSNTAQRIAQRIHADLRA